MNASHLISQCAWQTTYDQEAVRDLQDFISHWSNTLLMDLLDQCFNTLCPSTQIWRINSLDLDLGDILYEDLPHELPKRLRDRLHRAMEKMLATERVSIGFNDSGNLRIMDYAQSMQEFVKWFLQNGTAPWWFSGKETALQILDRQLEHAPTTTIDIIRHLGQSESVRQRLVWQLGEVRIRCIVQLLEPWQGDFICAFADNLFVLQEKQELFPSSASSFRDLVWLTILKHILVDRGTLFNTAAFVRANLWQVAQAYQIDYHSLLDQMFQAVSKLEPQGLIPLSFFSAIKTIYLQDRITQLNPILDSKVPPQDLWFSWQKMLHYGLKHQKVGSDTLAIDELFTRLAHQDADRMATLLLLEGHSLKVRQGLIKHFSFNELALLVQVLEPEEHPFILAHVQQTQMQIKTQGWNTETVWQVLLAYLFASRSSQFNRRQLVHKTLLELCKLHGFELAIFLDLLILTLQTEHPNHQHFELLGIFKELRREEDRKKPRVDPEKIYRQAALHYLKTGKVAAQSVAGEQQAQLILERMRSNLGNQSLRSLLGSAELHTTSNELLSLRLLKLVGAADLSLLINLLEPEAADFCVSLIESFLFWQKRAGLPALDGVDVAHQVPALLIQSLPGFYSSRQGSGSSFDLAVFWRGFVALLKQKAGVNIPAFYQQIDECLIQDGYWHSADATFSPSRSISVGSVQYLSDVLLQLIQPNIAGFSPLSASIPKLMPGHSSPAHVSSVVLDKQLTTEQLFSALKHRLISNSTDSTDDLPSALDQVPVSILWRQLEREGMDVISNWLELQPEKYQLLKALSTKRDIQPIGDWLSEQLPDELKPAEETIKHCAAFLQKTGYWQGAGAVLEKHLSGIFWMVSFDGRACHRSASELLARVLGSACLSLNIRLPDFIARIKNQQQLVQKTVWQGAYKLLKNGISQQSQTQRPNDPRPNNKSPNLKVGAIDAKKSKAGIITDFKQDYLAEYLHHPRFVAIARCLLQQGRPPAWLSSAQPIDLSRLLFDVFTLRPQLLKPLLADLQQQHGVMFRLLNIVPFAWLVDAMELVDTAKHSDVQLLEQFHRALQKIDIPHSNAKQRSAILFQQVLNHWLNDDWAALAPEKLVSHFLYQLMRQEGINNAVVQTAFASLLNALPDSLRIAISKVIGNLDAPLSKKLSKTNGLNKADGSTTKTKLAEAILSTQSSLLSTTPLRITNAGLVILQGFIPMFFSRLGLIENNQFLTPDVQRRAVHYLQFLVTGCTETAEQHLILNKLLCGLAVHEPVQIGIEISLDEEGLCHSLIHSVINYWEAVGSSSVDGFRGDWLVRDSSLTDAKDHWDLVVDRRAYDVLLARAPFSYSVIKLPWMEKAIYVTWPT